MNQNIKYINREISWLYFNRRVLQEAADKNVPLIERLKFLGIFSSNLDEFYRVRVGTLIRMEKAGIRSKALFGGSPKKILRQIKEIALEDRDTFDKTFRNLENELDEKNIQIINERELTQKQSEFVHNYFAHEVRPRLVPIMLDPDKAFPYLKNQVIYLAIYLQKQHQPDKPGYALIEVPADIVPRFLVLPKKNNVNYIIMLDDVIRHELKDIFAIFDFDRIEAFTIKLTRDAEIDIEDDVTKSFFEKISKSIKQRQRGKPVRFVYDREMPEDLLNFVLIKNEILDSESVIPGGRYHNARDFMHFPSVGSGDLQYEKIVPLEQNHIEDSKSIINTIRSKDVLLHYPYQSFTYVIDLLREAAIDPNVTSIKMTLYRLAQKSSVINALINARRNRKDVTVVIELQARFDEEANIYWTKKLEEEGARIIDGVPGLKVHAKLCLITRIENNKKVHYASIGTGNFNESTARIYSDHSLLTSHKHITQEVNNIFEFFENNYKTYTYKHLLVAPFYLRKKLFKYIKNEIKIARAGGRAYIHFKLNNLVDREMIDKLYQASQAGVEIKMIVRGICSLVAGVKGLSENIQVVSIIDKYLEHSRIFVFGNGGNERMYLSSADLMIRNLDNRVEVAVPVYDPKIREELHQFMNIQFTDNVKARIVDVELNNRYKQNNAEKVRAQVDIYKYLKSKN